MGNEDLSIIFLPSYSPQLNPTERFFQENLMEKALVDWMKNNEKVKNLCGYDWIIEAWKAKFKCNVWFVVWYNFDFGCYAVIFFYYVDCIVLIIKI